jgi:hypothetical protein
MKALFSKLALGTRFRHLGEAYRGILDKTYVKIEHNMIAEWDPDNISTGWTAQGVFHFTEDDADSLDVEVEVLEPVQ